MKKIIIIILFLLLAGVVAALATRAEQAGTIYNITEETYVKAAEILNKDADGDGLKDWEEELWKTNLQNPDTDGDGTPDGEEIRLRRDPLLAGPDDVLDEAAAKVKINEGAEKEDTATDLLTRDFFGKYMALRSQNGEAAITPEAIEALVEGALANNPAGLTSKQWNPTDITVQSSGTEALRTYANGAGKILLDHSPEGLESEFTILQNALESEDPELLGALDEHIALYQGVVSALLALPVPANASDAHLAVLNAFQGLRDADVATQKLWSDPLVALPAIPLFEQKSNELTAGLYELKVLLQKNNIRFDETESGYLIEQIELY